MLSANNNRIEFITIINQSTNDNIIYADIYTLFNKNKPINK